MALKKAIFLDKDGTLIDDVPFNVDPEKIRLASGVERALSLLRRHGYEFFVVSNQSGVASGKFREPELKKVELRINELLRPAGVAIRKFYWCPHAPESSCTCRKPNPGLFFRAALEHLIDLKRSWMIGDILHDVEAGHRAGCRSILMDNGNETEWEWSPLRVPDVMATSLEEAARQIVSIRFFQRGHEEGVKQSWIR